MRRLAIVGALVLLPGAARADTPATLEGVFAAANRAAWAHDYPSAINGYHELLRAGVEDADVYYDLATAYLLSDQLGQAMRFYERALRLRPGFEDAQHNLEQTRKLLGRRLGNREVESRSSPGRAVLGFFTLDGASWIFLGLWMSLWTIVAVRRAFAHEVRRIVTGVVLPIVAALTLLSGAVLGGKLHYERRGREAIVVAHERTTAKGGPGSEYPDAFQVNEGARVQIIAREGRWSLVRSRDGREAWLRQSAVGTL